MSHDYKHFQNISGFSIFSNNDRRELIQYHPPKLPSLLHSSKLEYDSDKNMVKITEVSTDAGAWDLKSKILMEGLDLKVSQLDGGVVTEVSAYRLNMGIIGPYSMDSYHVKVEYFKGLRVYIERLGWMMLAGVDKNSSDVLDLTNHTTVEIGEKLYYFNIKKFINSGLSMRNENIVNEPDTFLVNEFFTTEWFWVQR